VTDVKILSNPSLVVVDNGVATLQRRRPGADPTRQRDRAEREQRRVNTIIYQNTGIILRVVARRLQQYGDARHRAGNQPVSNTSATGILTRPSRSVRCAARSTFADGQTVLLACLISENPDKTRNGIPVLDQLPGLIGDASRIQNKTVNRAELIIFIGPQIIPRHRRRASGGGELRSKLNIKVGTVAPKSGSLLEWPPPRADAARCAGGATPAQGAADHDAIRRSDSAAALLGLAAAGNAYGPFGNRRHPRRARSRAVDGGDRSASTRAICSSPNELNAALRRSRWFMPRRLAPLVVIEAWFAGVRGKRYHAAVSRAATRLRRLAGARGWAWRRQARLRRRRLARLDMIRWRSKSPRRRFARILGWRAIASIPIDATTRLPFGLFLAPSICWRG